MRLSHRIFLGYFLVVAIAGFFLLKSVRDELRPAVRQSMEETLVDTANLLAEIVERDIRDGAIADSDFSTAVQDFLSREPNADIWGFQKNKITYRIYITNDKGIVVYDSDNNKAVGEDYSQWNDVYLTLKGRYGARSTKSDPRDDESSVMHVAAPIQYNGQIIGVLTVSKPNISVLPFIQLTQRNIVKAGLVLFVVALVLGWFISGFLVRSTRKLGRYAENVQQGKKTPLPKISEPELSQLGDAIESMRVALEGKEYAERYVHALTHEIKSPLSGITGASELLSEDMNVEDRARFIANIKEDTKRIQNIVDRLLDLAKLEQQQVLENKEPLDLPGIVEDILVRHEAQFLQKSLIHNVDVVPSDRVKGDVFLVRQAINNILDNAIDFSPENSAIQIKASLSNRRYVLTIQDEGQGVPPYARDKIFERFYSLPRPDTGKKSSGLGLSFVKEVMHLHHGDLRIDSGDKGCSVSLVFSID
ncbi:MAG: two-component system sensor histidine kinase CreC [Alphaproteobacteria bacterium]